MRYSTNKLHCPTTRQIISEIVMSTYLTFTRPLASNDGIAITFPAFPKLPQELQLLIWEACLPPPPRVVAITAIRHKLPSGRNCFRFRAAADAPVALHICRDSRKLALKSYEIAYSYQLGGHGVYFSFTKNAILLESSPENPHHFRSFFFHERPGTAPESRLRHVMLRGSRFLVANNPQPTAAAGISPALLGNPPVVVHAAASVTPLTPVLSTFDLMGRPETIMFLYRSFTERPKTAAREMRQKVLKEENDPSWDADGNASP